MAKDSKDPDYEQQMKDAAASGNFEDWVKAYRARNAAMPSSINGMSPQQALGPVEAMAVSPAGPPAPVAPASKGSPDAAIADIQARIKGGQPQTSPSAYDQFLAEHNINPNTIGDAVLVNNGTDLGNGTKGRMDENGNIAARKMLVPSMGQVEAATHLANQQNAWEGRAKIAARMALQRGDYGTYQTILNGLAVNNLANGGTRSADSARQYFLGRFRSDSPFQNFYNSVANTNGYASNP